MFDEENSLDPKNWEEFRALSHVMLDKMLSVHENLSDSKVWQETPEQIIEQIHSPLPEKGQGFEQCFKDFESQVLPYPTGNINPRFWGWVQGTGTPFAMMADMLASGLNPHMAGFNQAPAHVEETVMEWLKEIMGFDKDSSGLVTSGGTMANLIGLAVARNAKSEFDFREEGFHSAPRWVVYASSEVHKWAVESMELLGFGRQALRIVPVDDEYKINMRLLKEQVQEDLKEGFTPLCVIGTCGTVNTGAIDDLKAIGDFCRENNIWFHLDGAFGALAYLSEKYRNLTQGMELADSVAFDLHKWMYMPYEAGCVLVRPPGEQLKTFGGSASYITPSGRGVLAKSLSFSNLGIELTRSFKVLKVWMSFKAHGLEKFRKLITQNIDQVKYLKNLVESKEELEVLAPVSLNILCFRYRPLNKANSGDEKSEYLNSLNEEILLQLQERGIAVPSATLINGHFALRVAHVNHRSRSSDFDLLVRETIKLGRELSPKFCPPDSSHESSSSAENH